MRMTLLWERLPSRALSAVGATSVAMLLQAIAINSNFKEAIENYCTPANLRRVISEEVTRTLNAVIKEEVNRLAPEKGRAIIK
ncbi:MAG: hypothetical protein V4566_14345, partial [Pseudomonadota bacterium]